MDEAQHPYYGCLCLASRRLARVVTQLYDEALSETGLKITQFSVLTALDQAPGEAPRLGAIAEALDMEPSSLTRSLSPLLRRGLVELASGPDRRERRARVTHEGKRVLEQAHERWQHIQARLAEDIGEEDFHKLLALLHQGRQRIADRSAAHQEVPQP
ncbi:MarR family winged helix-turn-helix transcriptional regulator [Sediminicurvatus halobius]|nr:MarR family transcriptional regulator [Spiribacter halobius]UEX77690.1 MarR family transcriptional regulator [Spiribacter halobius]